MNGEVGDGQGGPRVDSWFGTGVPDVALVDEAGERLLVGTAHVLAGLLTAGLLQYAGSPEVLLGVLFPEAEGEARDRLMFTAGAVVGAGVGFRKGRARWDPAGLDEVAQELHKTGFEAMAQLAARAGAATRGTATVGRPDEGGDER